MQGNYQQIDNVMSECSEQVPQLIGHVRPKHKISSNAAMTEDGGGRPPPRSRIEGMPLGYTNKMLVGNELSSQWKEQLETNESLKKVLQIN